MHSIDSSSDTRAASPSGAPSGSRAALHSGDPIVGGAGLGPAGPTDAAVGDADNMTQQGSPFEDWLRRDETIMGTRPFVHVTDTVRAAQRYDAEQRARADLHASTS